MRVRVHGVFRFNGECVALPEAARRVVEREIACGLRALTPRPARVTLTLVETIAPDGTLEHCCQIRSRSGAGLTSTIVEAAPSVGMALRKALARLINGSSMPCQHAATG